MHARPRARLFTLPIVSWALYDFANTIFSFAVITRYFNEWVIDERGRPDWNVGLMSFVVGLLLIVAMPAVGAISDVVGRRLPFLAVFTIGCVAATAAIGVMDGTTAALVVCGIAIFLYQLSLSMYDPLLATVSPPGKQGAVSGIGVGTGYVGVLVGSTVLSAIVSPHHLQEAFLPTAVMFAVFAVPIFVFVRERGAVGGAVRERGVVGRALRQVRSTVAHIRSDHRHVGRFLLARFLYVDSIATVIAYMTVYMSRLGGFSKADKDHIIAVAIVFAAIGGFASGALVQRVGPKRVLVGILLLTTGTLLVAASTGSGALMWVLGPCVGVALGGVATSDRVLMLHLTPPALRGEFFGIYNLVGKLSSGFGPLVLWGGTIWLLHEQGSSSLLAASRVALAVLALAVVAGLLVLRPLSDANRYPDEEPASLETD